MNQKKTFKKHSPLYTKTFPTDQKLQKSSGKPHTKTDETLFNKEVREMVEILESKPDDELKEKLDYIIGKYRWYYIETMWELCGIRFAKIFAESVRLKIRHNVRWNALLCIACMIGSPTKIRLTIENGADYCRNCFKKADKHPFGKT